MKVRSVLMCLAACALSVCVHSARGDPPKGQDNTLVNALIQVESNGNDTATGDGGAAVGCLQIHKVLVDDVNRILGKQEFTYNDRLDRDKSIAMFNVFTNHYSPGASNEVKARRWNGGPKGDRRAGTVAYWRKVQRHLNTG